MNTQYPINSKKQSATNAKKNKKATKEEKDCIAAHKGKWESHWARALWEPWILSGHHIIALLAREPLLGAL